MTSFLDGPAKGKSLMLKRSPLFLRVVVKGGEWDALDQVADEPAQEETVHVYERTLNQGSVHLLLRGNAKAASGFYARAHYRLHDHPPAERTLRSSKLWQTWCRETPLSPLKEES